MSGDHERSDPPRMLTLPLSRRAFLQAATGTTAGLLAARAVGAATLQSSSAPTGIADALAPIDDLAWALDYDVDRIFRFVTDEIAYEPYAGALRGAHGTLESRAGNATDKAALLAALLDAARVEVRFVEGTLADDAVETLRASWLIDAATADARAAAVLQGTQDGLSPAPTSGPPDISALPPDARAVLDQAVDRGDAVVVETTAMLDTGIRTITGALAARGMSLPDAPDDLPALERDRHVWVQARRGVDWVDLDPTIAGSEGGATIATPVVTDLAAIPDELRHRVEIRLTVERIAGDGLEQEVILEAFASADRLAGQPIVLGHDQPEGLEGLGVGIDQMLTGTNAYQPVLQVADTIIVGQVGLRLGGGGGALDGFGDDDPESREGEATAEWLQVVTIGPDGTRSVADRVLFDRIGAEQRAAGAIDITTIPRLELVPLVPDGPPDFAPARAVHFLAVATGSTSPRIAAGIEDDDQGSAWALHVVPHLYHLARDAAGVAVAPGRGVRLFHDGPNVVRYTLEMTPGSTDGSYDATLDILARNIRPAPVVGAPIDAAPGIVAGVLSHVLERVVMGAGDATGPDPDLSVGAVLEAAAAQGIGTLVLAPGDDVTGLPFGAQALTTLRAVLDEGLVAIGPERPVVIGGEERVGWWLVDPTTGRVADRMDDGRGASMLERAIQHYTAFLARHPYLKLGLCIGLTIKALLSLLEFSSGRNPAKGVLGAVSYGGKLRTIACA